MGRRTVAKYKPLKGLYDEQGKTTRQHLLSRWMAETEKTERAFQYRLDQPEFEDYYLFALVLGVPIEKLLGREPFPLPEGQQTLVDFAASLGLGKQPQP